MVDLFIKLIEALWLILPAYFANGLIPLAKGKHPIDFNKKFIDNQPLFGKGKTWEGFFLGCFVGFLIGSLQWFIYDFISLKTSKLNLIKINPLLGFLLGLGAVFGDLVGSFIKRRLKMPRGHPFPLLDQEDFLLGSLFFVYWFIKIEIEWFLILLIITPIIHLIANLIAYLTKIKKEPW